MKQISDKVCKKSEIGGSAAEGATTKGKSLEKRLRVPVSKQDMDGCVESLCCLKGEGSPLRRRSPSSLLAVVVGWCEPR